MNKRLEPCPPTNADLVQAMSDEDRLKWLHKNFGGRSFPLKELMDRLAQPAPEGDD